ncbi:Protein ltv1 [Neophaeococcomyces mojaviensis]|uniref:Protein ltv1 n=1 Tax=Neophaeococcomyces mojaviensis TaxID=3383035 RepID=A0ACC3AE71_9EURO|nr:Protein ltv1 [Knufia sp. JES_112]
MPRRKWIDKHNPSTKTYQLLYRSQDDPLLNDDNAGERALFEVGHKGESSARSPVSHPAGLHLADLEDDLDFESMRDNEGEAAEHGIYFDDTSYDYMQHLRDLGEGAGNGHWIDAVPTQVKGKKKGQSMRLEDALREVNLDDEESVAPSLVDGGLSTFSRSTKQRGIEVQQDVPDEIAGFQPDMDPRLREVLEALDDDAYVDEKDEEDVFGELALDGNNNGELHIDEFEANFVEDDGWESDVTEKAPEQLSEVPVPVPVSDLADLGVRNVDTPLTLDSEAAATAAAEDGDWLRDFAKYKRDSARKAPPPQAASITAASAVHDQAPSLYTLNGTPLRQKKRKGALTNPSAYSMTSSSLNRGDGLQLLDARFDQMEKMYSVDEAEELDDMDGSASMISGMTGASKMSKMSALSTSSFAEPGAVRQDFDGMMDDFLGGWNKANPGGGKRHGAKSKRGKNGNEVFGLQQLDEVRKGLGPARVHGRAQKA